MANNGTMNTNELEIWAQTTSEAQPQSAVKLRDHFETLFEWKVISVFVVR